MFRVKDPDGKISNVLGNSAKEVVELNKKMGVDVEVIEEKPILTNPDESSAANPDGIAQPPGAPPQQDSYFTEAGIDFKVSRGKLYKAEWIVADECSDYRIEFLDETTDKSKIVLKKKTWTEIALKRALA